MTQESDAKVERASDAPSPNTTRRTDTHSSDVVGVILHGNSDLSDIASLEPKAFMALYDERVQVLEALALADALPDATETAEPAAEVRAGDDPVAERRADGSEDDAWAFESDTVIVTESGDVVIRAPASLVQAITGRPSGTVTLRELAAYGESTETAADTFAAPPGTAEDINAIYGDDGANWIEGTDGADAIYGLDGEDILLGLACDDFLFGGGHNDTLIGGAGDDLLVGGSGSDDLFGNAGDDRLVGGAGDNDLWGEDGNDLFFGGENKDAFKGGDGIDTVSFVEAEGQVTAFLELSAFQDTGQGWDSFSEIENLIGSDYADWLVGDGANNRLEGAAGDDTIDGRHGNDYLAGGEGNDFLTGGFGNDIFDGGPGGDTADFSNAAFAVTVNLSLGNDAWSTAQNTGEGIDSFIDIEKVRGSSLGDLIRGNGESNTLIGNGGNDWIWGGPGADGLFGGYGADVLVGESGDDYLEGGADADVFFYGDYFGDAGDDRITDFEDGVDKVFLNSGLGVSEFSDITIGSDADGNAVASFTGGVFGGSITFLDVNANLIGADDFVFV